MENMDTFKSCQMTHRNRKYNHLLTAVILCILFGLVCCDYPSDICHTWQYRSLSIQLQNEHQCLTLDKLRKDFEREMSDMRKSQNDLFGMITNFQTSIVRHIQSMNTPSKNSAKAIPVLRDIPLVRDCHELHMNGVNISGVYPLRLPNRNILNVWCDMDTDYGGWTVIQRRMDGSVNFTRGWEDYAFGFGNANTEYWLGNENIFWITSLKNYTLRIDLWDWEDNHVYAIYDTFFVESEQNQYRLRIGDYSGTAGDAMSPYHDNMKFSTIDEDNDEWNMHCAKKDQSGWWFRACGFASLNGVYIHNGKSSMSPDGLIKGIIWFQWKNDYGYSMKRTEIKLKPRVQVRLDREKFGKINSDTDNDNDKEKNEKIKTVQTTVATRTTGATIDESTPVNTNGNFISTETVSSTQTNFYGYDDDYDY